MELKRLFSNNNKLSPSASKFLLHYQIPWAMKTQDQNSTMTKGQVFFLFQSFFAQLIAYCGIKSNW